MYFNLPSFRRLLITAFYSILSLTAVRAQQSTKFSGATPEEAVVKAVGMMRNGQWTEARDAFAEVIAQWGTDKFYKDSPPFGTVYYNKGYCEMQLKQYQEASKSFEICNTKFPSRLSSDKDPGGTNVYEKLSVFQWGAAEQAQENYDKAITLYKKFMDLKPNPRVDQFTMWAYLIKLGTCYARANDIPNAEVSIGTAIQDRLKLVAPISVLWSGFIEVLEAYSRQSDADPDGKKSVAFIDKYTAGLVSDDIATAVFAERLLKLGQDAVKSGKTVLALRVIGLVPKTEDIMLAADIAGRGRLNGAEKASLESWEKAAESGEPKELFSYFGLAQLYQGKGALRACFVIYDYMASHFTKTKHRPTILYGATKMASDIGEMMEVQKHGLAFLKEYPDHEYAPSVQSLLLSSLFFNGEYERCLEIASNIRPNFQLGSTERDLPDFVYAGSLYYLGRYDEAQPELDSHVEHYKESVYRENVTYYQASNLLKLFEWQRASTLLDAWLEKYEPEDSPLLDVAYLDRATCYFALSSPENGGNQKALGLVDKILDKYPNSSIRDRALALRGDVQQNDGIFDKAELSYLDSLAIAQAEEHDLTASTNLMQLITVTTAQEKFDDAIKYYDAFFEKYPTSFYAPNAAIAALPAFKEKSPAQLDRALKQVQELIVHLGENSDTSGVERTLNAYTDFLLKEKDAHEVIDILDGFPNKLGYRTLEAWIYITKIGIIEERLASDSRMMAKAAVYYDYLEKEFKKDELGDYILMRLGSKIAETNPQKARPWFEAVVNTSKDNDLKSQAQAQLAIIDSKSPDASVRTASIAQLNAIRKFAQDNTRDGSIIGPATLALARVYHAAGDWKNANTEWQAYMTEKSFRDARSEALFKLAESYEKLGMKDEALVSYSQITVLFAGYLDYSAEAVNRAAQIFWDRGDHLKAFRYINTFHFRMKGNDHPKVTAMAALRDDFMNQMKAKNEWKDEYLEVRDTFGQIKPPTKKP